MLSGLRSFESPHITHYEKMLLSEGGLKIKALFDPQPYTKNIEQRRIFKERLKNVENLMNKYEDKIKIRYTLVTHATSRRVMFDSMAIDAKKLLPFYRKEPSYIGTIYLKREDINFLQENFNAAWEHSKDIKDYEV